MFAPGRASEGRGLTGAASWINRSTYPWTGESGAIEPMLFAGGPAELMGVCGLAKAGGGVDLWFVLGYDQGFVRGFGFF